MTRLADIAFNNLLEKVYITDLVLVTLTLFLRSYVDSILK